MVILDRFDLSGRSAIVTGAGSGLGRAMAIALAQAGADIVGVGRRREVLEESRGMVEALGRRFLVHPTDVTDSAQVNAMVAHAIAEMGRIDILINNAGGGGSGAGKSLPELTDEDWHSGIDSNLTSAFYCTRAIVPHMLERGGGRIINVASSVGFRAMSGAWMYPIAKAGIVSLTRAIGFNYARDGIRCSCIAPGRFPFRATAETKRAIGERQVAGRIGEPDEIAAAAVFLSSPAADYLSGETLIIDGGVVAAGIIPFSMRPVVEG
ncbi:MAG: SDR family oxidoreductase [Dehalococcoidia bacterium]|nr:SDR family oxidoreductase [Dehalococcoidia bacterium]